jgi:hypothetical protein
VKSVAAQDSLYLTMLTVYSVSSCTKRSRGILYLSVQIDILVQKLINDRNNEKTSMTTNLKAFVSRFCRCVLVKEGQGSGNVARVNSMAYERTYMQ